VQIPSYSIFYVTENYMNVNISDKMFKDNDTIVLLCRTTGGHDVGSEKFEKKTWGYGR